MGGCVAGLELCTAKKFLASQFVEDLGEREC